MSTPPPRSGQVFAAPTALRDRLGPRFGKIDPDALAKAEAALKGLSSQFGQWLEDEVGKLEAARDTAKASGGAKADMDRVYGHGHDLKGLGSTYEYPLITRIAASLCRLLGEGDGRSQVPIALVVAHVDAIRAAVRDGIKDVDHPVGRSLVTVLEQRTSDYISPPRANSTLG